MSDSDSALSSSTLSNTALEKGLRATFKKLQREQVDEDLTINIVRRAAEKRLSLEDGFFGASDWKAKSKRIITDELNNATARELSASPVKPAPVKVSKPQIRTNKDAAPGRKRKIHRVEKAREPGQRKKSRTSEDSEEQDRGFSEDDSDVAESEGPGSLHGDDSDDEEAPRKGARKQAPDVKAGKNRKATAVNHAADATGDSALSDVESDSPAPNKPAQRGSNDEASESEMSVLIDDDPPPKSRKKSASSDSKSTTKGKQAASKSKEKAAPDPNQEEVKKLQNQLGQCGIRKVWGKYLKPYETSRAKIKHLKEMLADAGMPGRFSADKAKQIREQRELAADLEAVQEGEKVWGRRRGQKGGEAEEGEEKPKRAATTLAKGLIGLDEFISDGEES